MRWVRLLRWLALLAALAVLAGAGLRYVWLPGYRPALSPGERFGVDVSNHQGRIDWPRVAADDMAFAYLKATEGADYVDDTFARNWAEADAAGLRRGAYHFFTLCRPGRDQADNFLRVVPDDPRALPPVVDVELGGNCAARPDRDWLDRELRAFLERVESAGRRPVVAYFLDDAERLYGLRDTLGRPRWTRSILRRPPADDWWIWQVGGFSRVDGIDGPADLNVMRPGPAPGP